MSIVASKIFARSAKGLFAALAITAALPAAAQAQEIIVNIARVRALDVIDKLSKADFLARVTIDGEAFTTPAVRNQDDIRPNWTLRKRVSPGVHNIKIEILDKDVSKNDLIDINRINGKRDLDFQVDTRNCIVTGFQQAYRCRSVIQRGGNEAKKAEITFTVDVGR